MSFFLTTLYGLLWLFDRYLVHGPNSFIFYSQPGVYAKRQDNMVPPALARRAWPTRVLAMKYFSAKSFRDFFRRGFYAHLQRR